MAVPEEILRVPEVRLNGNIDVHILQDVKTVLFRFAVCRLCCTLKTFASINHEEEVRKVTIVIGRGLVLEFDLPLASVIGGVLIGASVILDVLSEH